jgi:hypothetical protein
MRLIMQLKITERKRKIFQNKAKNESAFGRD